MEKKILKGVFSCNYFIHHCFICRHSDSTVSVEDAGNEPRTVVTSALAVRFVIFGGFFITKIGSPDISKIINKAHKISSKNGASNSFWRVLQVFALSTYNFSLCRTILRTSLYILRWILKWRFLYLSLY
jgi:hypothetical protein